MVNFPEKFPWSSARRYTNMWYPSSQTRTLAGAAGIPLLSFRLAHKSRQVEAGYKRDVECEMNAIAMGELALEMSRLQAGQAVRVDGFLNRRSRSSTQLILHVTKHDR